MPKNDQIWPKICIFGHFEPNIGIFCLIWSHAQPKNDVNKVPWWFFSYVGTKTFAYSHNGQIVKWSNLAQNMHFWSFWVKYWQFLPILSHARPKNNGNKVPWWVFRYVGNKTFDFSSKKKDFLPKNDQIWPKIGIFGQFGPGHASLFSALLMGWLVVVARGLYLARHLFTLYYIIYYMAFLASFQTCRGLRFFLAEWFSAKGVGRGDTPIAEEIR